MFGSNILDTAIGLVLIFFILSIVLSAVRETIEALLQTRAINLERGIRELLQDPTGAQITKDLYDHPLISSLFRGQYSVDDLVKKAGDDWKRLKTRSKLPAYIPTRSFALALIDLTARGTELSGDEGAITIAKVRAGIDTLPNEHLKRAMLVALDNVGNDIDRLRANIEQWFNSGMDRVSGWYRKRTQWILFWIGLGAAVLLNVDTINMAHYLYTNDSVRAVMVAQAQETVDHAKLATGQSGTTPDYGALIGCPAQNQTTSESSAMCAQQSVMALPAPIGWTTDRVTARAVLFAIPGWILTALAISLGAPFWFDLLNKMMVIRSTVKPHQKSPEEASVDRQTPLDPAPPPSPTPAVAAPAPLAPPQPSADAEDQPVAVDPDFVPHQWAPDSGKVPQEGDI